MTSPTPGVELVHAVHGGIQYTGELVRSPAWERSFGSALDADAYFRVVFLESRGRLPAVQIDDARIAVYVPAPRSAAHQQAEAELRTLREARATYATDPDSGEAIDSQVQRIEERVVEEWAASFRGGRVVASPPMDLDMDLVFGSGYWSAWAERIGEHLLARAYPSLPVDAAALRVPLRPEQDAPALFDAVTGEPSGAATATLEAFGRALGISAADDAATVDLSRCPALGVVAAEAEREPVPGLGRRLAHDIGLTYPLATLFALLYVLREPAEVRLGPSHGLRLRDGSALAGPSITARDLPHLSWPRRFWPDVEGIGPAEAARADDSERYLGVLGLTRDDASDEERRAALQRWLGTMSDGLLSVTQHLTAVAGAQGRELASDELEPLARIRSLIDVGDALEVGSRAERVFGGIEPFRRAMRLWESWRVALPHAASLIGALDFLHLAAVDEDRRELFVERAALEARLRDPALLTSPHQWAALAEEGDRFRRAYAVAYVRHHDAYHTQMGTLAHRMADVASQAQALARLNSVQELGRPVAPELPALAEELHNEVHACGAVLQRDAIAQKPLCPACVVRLDAAPLTDEVESLAGYVREALGEQNARLARTLAHRLIRREGREGLDRFIQVVSVSDLSGLGNVLDDELASFIGDLLREGPR